MSISRLLPSIRTHHPVVHIEGVGLTAPPVAAVPVAVAPVAGVEGAGDGVLVALHHVVLGAPDVVAEVGVTIPVPGTRVVACRNIVWLQFLLYSS